MVFLITVALLITSLILTLVFYTSLNTKGAADYQKKEDTDTKKALKKHIRRKTREIRFAIDDDKSATKP